MSKSRFAIGSDLRKVDAHVIARHEYEEAPELTDEQLASAVVSGAKPRRQRGSERPKQVVKLQLDKDIISAYRSTGEDWQTRINADLRRARKLDTATRAKSRR